MLYVPQLGHAMCCCFGSWQRSHETRVGTAAFHCDRRWRVLLRDIFRFEQPRLLLLLLVGARFGGAAHVVLITGPE